MRRLQLGDWVQATHEERDENGELVALEGAIGHVVTKADKEGTVTVWFERTGRATVCGEGDVKFLGDANTGKAHKERTRGN